jgi:hypothetical protein
MPGPPHSLGRFERLSAGTQLLLAGFVHCYTGRNLFIVLEQQVDALF